MAEAVREKTRARRGGVLSPSQVADLWGTSPAFVRQMVKEGRLPRIEMKGIGAVLIKRTDAAANVNLKSLYFDRAKVTKAEHHVYFIKCGEFVKIGTSKYLASRLCTIRNAIPYDVEFMGAIAGDRHAEQALHDHFRKHHHRREWFRLEGDLANYVGRLSRG